MGVWGLRGWAIMRLVRPPGAGRGREPAMSGQAVRVVGAALAALAGLAALAAVLLLAGRGCEGDPVRIVAPGATGGGAAAGGGGDAAATMAAGGSRAQISGAVVSPGVYPVRPGDRLLDLVAAAGGFTHLADVSGVNLSIRVKDETRYHIPVLAEAGGDGGDGDGGRAVDREPAAGAGSGDGGGRVDLNAATARELESLPGIGPALAGAIVAYREANGPFAAVDELDEVPGIGPKTLENIRPLVAVLPGDGPGPAPLPGTQTEIRH